ncbi:isoform II [Desulfosporosinus sp. BICA1-9]|uniref:alpha/beta hydrolase family protein n=1 Tax=Desulfosporosinus sp. BICA1-9 TaxID=1531958 RepID=UPI000AC06EA0|nr:isoform II [Desulfosporosinus sp. BICA1-9]HBW38713.1 isoform II [Desulfosporosinus sp.]
MTITKYAKMSQTKSANMVQIMVTLYTLAAFPRLIKELPKPGGMYPVGTTHLSFTDKSRKGLLTDKDADRELAVQVWYPAEGIDEGNKALYYVPDKRVSKYLAKALNLPNIFKVFDRIKTHGYLNAPLSSAERKFPVLFFSHGYSSFVGQNTILMEELASRGYIVFSLAHTYETCASIYPDGSIIPFQAEQIKTSRQEVNKLFKEFDGDQNSNDFIEYMVRNAAVFRKNVQRWSDDTIFVTDQVEKMEKGEIDNIFKGRLDLAKLGIFGHSLGGATAGQVCITDNRFKAFVNLDGYPYGDVIFNKISTPFMILTNIAIRKNIGAGFHPEQTGYMIVDIKDSKHFDFTDLTVFFPALKKLNIPEVLGSINGERQVQIVNDYVLAFFNKHLKGNEEPLVDQELTRYPEVTIQMK